MNHLLTHEARKAAQEARELAKSPEELLQDAGLDLGPRQRASVLKRLLEMPESSRRTFLLALWGTSRQSAIKAFCMECVGWEREEVRNCTATACPLWAHRPWKSPLPAP